MKVIQAKDDKELSELAADLIAQQITEKKNSVLGLATGSTPEGTYARLVERYQKGELDFSGLTTINLDEYVGMDGSNVQSYRYFMNSHLFDHVNIDKSRTFVPDAVSSDPEQECRRYDERVEKLGGIDLQLLGIGGNGHIGFNEPGESFIGDTHVVKLGEETIRANARFFASPEEVPTSAITLGIRSIMQARKVLLIASGVQKAAIVEAAVKGPITPRVPASVLQLHRDCTVIVCP